MWSGADWNWHKPVQRNDEITTEAWLKDLIEHETQFAGRAVQQIYHVDFFNQHGDLVADADSWCFRTERDHAREKGTKYKEVQARSRRAATPTRSWPTPASSTPRRRSAAPRRATGRTSTEGEALPTMVKGPMTVTGFIAYAQGWGGLYIRANKLAWKLPGRASRPRHQESLRHSRLPRARALGRGVRATRSARPAPTTTARSAARGSPITSPTGWATTASCATRTCKIRRHNPEGDMLFIKGKVTRKFVEDGRHLVEIEQEARNQDDELSVLGTGIVELPVARLTPWARWTAFASSTCRACWPVRCARRCSPTTAPT